MASESNASLIHAHNENTLALPNVTLDFSLFKIQLSVEFTGLGSSLSEQRRVMAEDGLPHQTARKLGALFEQIIPSTPLDQSVWLPCLRDIEIVGRQFSS
jgi:hypothetical protein